MARLVADRAWAIMTIWQEARGEEYAGKLAVAEVIWNRMQRHYSSDGTVIGTVLRPLQFSGWNTHDANRRLAAKIASEDHVVSDCDRAWTAAQAGSDTVKGAVLYCNLGIVRQTPLWVANSTTVARVGAHTFFVPKGWVV